MDLLFISNTCFCAEPALHVDEARSLWTDMFPSLVSPTVDKEMVLDTWDSLLVESTFDRLLDSSSDGCTRARLITVSAPESGAWLRSLPISSLGLRLEDVTVRVCVGLQLDLPVCAPHCCQNCGAPVCLFGTIRSF